MIHWRMDLFDDTAAIFNSIVSNSYYGMLRGQISMYLSPQHPWLVTWNNRIQNGRWKGPLIFNQLSFMRTSICINKEKRQTKQTNKQINPEKPWFFFRLLLSNCLNWKIYCDDHSSLSSTTAVQILFHIYFTSNPESVNNCAQSKSDFMELF